ncbi:hypothetical protein MMC24_003598 [Lignoscripta atroalba]|nr:hypothetical protein [Lignoscripta atroalba]
MHLRHLHLPALTPYTRASHLQSLLLAPHLNHKALAPPLRKLHPPPPPTLLTFQTPPTYTCGRREINTLTPQQITYLRADNTASFHEALRGGQTTFHGPGQLTAYLILSLSVHGLSPRTYVRMLETCLIGTCAHYGVKGFVTENPGVWVSEEEKIASVGVHLRRGVASHGVGLNVSTEVRWFERIVACGLVGKKTTTLEREGVRGVGVEDVGRILAGKFAEELKDVDGVDEVSEDDAVGVSGGEKDGGGQNG